MARRNKMRRPRGYRGQHIVCTYATFSTGSTVVINAKELGIPYDRPAKPLSISIKLFTDKGTAYVSVAVIDGNKETCCRLPQIMANNIPVNRRGRVFRGTDFDHYSAGDKIVEVDVAFSASAKPSILSIQVVVNVALAPRNINSYGFLASPGCLATTDIPDPTTLSVCSVASSFRRLSI